MSKSMPKDLRTLGYVLRRTNYGESDRILNLITPHGKLSVIAKAARKEKSKLAGGIEMFTLTDFNLHFGKGELGIVTGAKMQKFHQGIIKDFARIELASEILKQINKISEGSFATEYFKIVDETLEALGEGENLDLVRAWFLVRLKQSIGEEINLYRDNTGAKLAADQTYNWDNYERVFTPAKNGEYGANEIKLLRLMAANDLSVVRRVKISPEMLPPLLRIVETG